MSGRIIVPRAVADRLDCKLDVAALSKHTFPLPTLDDELIKRSTSVHKGRGFFVLHGWKPEEYSDHENALVYIGISSYIAERRGRQNQSGMMLSQYLDILIILKYTDKHSPYYGRDYSWYSSGKPQVRLLQLGSGKIPASSIHRYLKLIIFKPFHADVVCDVLALFCLKPAASGGENLIASSWTVYNELAATRPDLIHVLANADWVHDTYG